MYKVLFKNKRLNGSFGDYETARQFARKDARKRFPAGQTRNKIANTDFSWDSEASCMWDGISRNPTNLTELGYVIKPIN